MRRFLAVLCTFIGLLLIGPSAPSEAAIGSSMPHACYSVVHVESLGLITGSYAGDGWIYKLDHVTLSWERWRRLPITPGHESISYFTVIDGGAGLNAFTESDDGPQCFTAWSSDDWRFSKTPTRFPRGMMYALGGPETAAEGVVAISTGHGRRIGGVLARWDVDAWKPFTPELWARGKACLIWTAAVFEGRLLVGSSADTKHYNTPGVGVLAEFRNDQWQIIPTPNMAGITRLTRLESDPEALYLSTTHGAIWRTADLIHFELFHPSDGSYGDAWIFDLNSRIVVASAKGQVWNEGRLLVDHQDTTWMSLIKTDAATLAGTIILKGEKTSRPLRVDQN